MLYRDQLRNNDWWTYNGYIQDCYSRGRWRINGGLRYDWQQSKYLGGCVPANAHRAGPAAGAVRGRDRWSTRRPASKIQSFSNWSPRVVGHLRPARQRQDRRARQLLVLLRHEDHAGERARRPLHQPSLTWGTKPVERRVQHHGGRPVLERRQPRHDRPGQRADRHADSSSSRFNSTTGVLAPAGNMVDPRAQIGRTREGIVGIQHELIAEPRGRRRLHLPQVRSRHDDLHASATSRAAGYTAARTLYRADHLHRSE